MEIFTYRPESESVACDSCGNVVEVVVTNSSPDGVVIQFQTTNTTTVVANQSQRYCSQLLMQITSVA